MVGLGTWCSYWADQRTDQYQLIHLGKRILDGGRMYVDAWENKPPGLAWINALGLSISGLGPWLLPGLMALVGLAAMSRAARMLLSPIAAGGTLALAAVVFTLRLYDTPSINPDCYSSLTALAAVSCWLAALSADHRGRTAWLGLLAGMLWACATLFKQTGIVGIITVTTVALLLTLANQEHNRRWLATAALSWLGFAIVAGATAGLLYRSGTLELAKEAVWDFNRGLVNLTAFSAHALWTRTCAGLSPLAAPLLLALIGLIATLRAGSAGRLSSAFACTMALWWVAEVVLALLGPSRSMRYWQGSFPPMLWLAAAGAFHLEDGFRRLPRGHRSALGIGCLTALVLLGRPLVDAHAHGVAQSQLAYAKENRERDRLRALGERIQSLVPGGDTLFVWAYDPGVYLFADRPAAGRHTYPRSADQMAEILSYLEDGKADAWLIPTNGSARFDHWCDDACHQRLDAILAARETKGSAGNYQVWTSP